MLTPIIIVLSITLGCFVIYNLYEIIKKHNRQVEEQEKIKEAEQKVAKEKAEAERKAQQEKVEADFALAYNALVDKYGDVTTSVQLGIEPKDISSWIYVFEKGKMLSLRGRLLPFEKVLAFSLNDDSETVLHNETTYSSETKTSTGSMLGRAVVGGVLLGGVGALAGATTAKKETVTSPTGTQTSKVRHKYTLYINLDDFTNPIEEIKLGSDTKRAQTIANIFNIIVQRNSK